MPGMLTFGDRHAKEMPDLLDDHTHSTDDASSYHGSTSHDDFADDSSLYHDSDSDNASFSSKQTNSHHAHDNPLDQPILSAAIPPPFFPLPLMTPCLIPSMAPALLSQTILMTMTWSMMMMVLPPHRLGKNGVIFFALIHKSPMRVLHNWTGTSTLTKDLKG